MAAINTGNNLLYLLLGWMLSMIIASGVLSESTLRRLTVTRRPPKRIFSCTPFAMEVLVENPRETVSSYSVEVADLVDNRPLTKRCYFLKVPPGKTQTTFYQHEFLKRGQVTFNGSQIATRFPFGLFRKSRDTVCEHKIVVFPAIHPVSIPNSFSQNQGQMIAGRMSRQGEFFGLREYTDNDDLRSIHWRSSAKLGRMVVREYEDESQKRVSLALENGFPSAITEDDAAVFEKAVSLAASYANAYEQDGYSVRFVTRIKTIEFGNGPKHLDRILEHLATIQPEIQKRAFPFAVKSQTDNILVTSAAQNDLAVSGTVHHRIRAER